MTRDGLRIAEIDAGEIDAWIDGEAAAWGSSPTAPRRAWRDVVARGRCLVAELDGEIVGGVGMLDSVLTVPGGELPVTLITSAWVRRDRRKRGLLRALTDAAHADMARRGIAASALIASESGIYRGFGYGVATTASTLRIRRLDALLDGDRAEDVRIVARSAFRDVAQSIYEQLRRTQPGMLARAPYWWDFSFTTEGEDAAEFFVVHDGPAGCDGYAAYRVAQQWKDGLPADRIVVQELVALTPAATRALWAHCLDIALSEEIEAHNRPPDDPLSLMLRDPRRLTIQSVDSLHLCLLDPAAALARRRYAGSGRLVLAVARGADGEQEARLALQIDEAHCQCGPTTQAADLWLGPAALASAYLGTVAFDSLARAGLARELTPGSLARADRMFATWPRPWLPWDY